MRYWSYLALKLFAAAGLTYGLLAVVALFFPNPPASRFGTQPMFLHDMPFTFAIFGVFLFGVGLIYVAVWDQRRRCRTCLRRLIMPIATGSWGNMLTFGRPRIEWICPYGHGTLRISELQITGSELPDWQPHEDDIWRELESYDHSNK
jgi:hypothetical protein